MKDNSVQRRAVLAILDFLKTAEVPPSGDSEAVTIAADCLSAAYGVSADDATDLQKYNVQPGMLLSLLHSSSAAGSALAADGGDSGGSSGPAAAGAAAAEPTAAVASAAAEGAAAAAVPAAGLESSKGKEEGAGDEEEGKKTAGEESGSRVAVGEGADAAAAAAAAAELDVDAKLQEFLAGLESAGYYEGTAPGSWEHLERERQARKIFEHSVKQAVAKAGQGSGSSSTGKDGGSGGGGDGSSGSSKAAAEGSSSASASATAAAAGSSGGVLPVSDADKAEAEKLKSEGNAAMAEKRYSEAAALYTRALTLNDANAIYWANRAAVHLQLGNFSEALSDSQQAIQLDGRYSKAFSRLGHAYMGLGQYREAIDKGFKKALELDPHNAGIKEALKAAKRKLDEQKQQQQGEREEPPPASSSGAASSTAHSDGSAPTFTFHFSTNPQQQPQQQQHHHHPHQPFPMPINFVNGMPMGGPNAAPMWNFVQGFPQAPSTSTTTSATPGGSSSGGGQSTFTFNLNATPSAERGGTAQPQAQAGGANDNNPLAALFGGMVSEILAGLQGPEAAAAAEALRRGAAEGGQQQQGRQ